MGTNDTVRKWTYILNKGGADYVFGPKTGLASDNLETNEKIIVIKPAKRVLQLDTAGKFYANFINTGDSDEDADTFAAVAANKDSLVPAEDSLASYIIYGLTPSTVITPRRPFNRADYYIRRPATNMPSRCSPDSGILYKAVLSQTSVPSDWGLRNFPSSIAWPI